MQAQRFPVIQGLKWFVTGLDFYRRNAAIMGMCALIMLAGLVFVNLLMIISFVILKAIGIVVPNLIVSLINMLIVSMLFQLLLVGCFRVFKAIDQNTTNEPPQLALLWRFDIQLKPLLLWGALYMIAVVGVLSLTSALFDLDLLTWGFKVEQSPTATPPAEKVSLFALLFLCAGMIPILIADYFAAPLIGLYEVRWPKAAFFSMIGCWRNFSALVLFVVANTLFSGLLLQILAWVAHLIPVLRVLGIIFIPLVILPIWLCMRYVSFREVFAEEAVHG